MKRAARRWNAGFTLLEVMLSLAIIATTIFALLYMRSRAIDHVGTAKESRVLWVLLQKKVGDFDEIKIDEIAEGTESGGFEEEEFEGAQWTRTITKVEMAMIEKVDDDHPREMWRVQIAITWPRAETTELKATAEFFRLLKEDDVAPEAPPPGGG